MPSRRDGVSALQLAGEDAQLLQRPVVVVDGPGGAQPPPDGVAGVLGQVVEHVAFSLKRGVLSTRPGRVGRVLLSPRGFGWAQFSFGACLRTPCRWELSRLLNSLWAVQSARTQLEFAGAGAAAPRGREGVKGC
jgi:hypothetical protein